MSKTHAAGELPFSKNDVEIIARETPYRGFFSLDLYRVFATACLTAA